jgi:rSAM/selenodomain-associated transferase 2
MKLAVIMPTLNEAAALPATLAALQGAHEIIVADGGSTDQSCAIAEAAGARVLHLSPPRATQLNAAAASCDADAILFLHADTHVPVGWQKEIERLLSRSDTALGAFSLGIASATRSEAIVARAANLRSRWRSLPYGDQGLFLRKDLFDELGGFPDVPIMDDYILVQHAQKRGAIVTSDLVAMTSNRRWRRLGVWRTSWRNLIVVVGYRLGVSLDRLQRYYRG